MRKFLLTAAFMLLAGCVTINVYFPAAAAQKAADQVVNSIMGPADQGAAPAPATSSAPPPASQGGASSLPAAAALLNLLVPAAQAAEPTADLHIQTPAIQAIEARMRQRFQAELRGLLVSGAIGFTHNGDVAIHDAAKIPLADRSRATQAVADENRDRADLYRQIAVANGHPEWAARMRESFAKVWIQRARPGWYYQNASGAWQQK